MSPLAYEYFFFPFLANFKDFKWYEEVALQYLKTQRF